MELNKRFLQAYLQFKDEPRVQQLKTDVLQYNRLLHDLGLRELQQGAPMAWTSRPCASAHTGQGLWNLLRGLRTRGLSMAWGKSTFPDLDT